MIYLRGHMEVLIYILIVSGVVVLLFFYQKWTSKQNLIGSNTLLQSDATTKAIDSISREEEKEQEARLMQNKRYRILHEILMNEVKTIEALSSDQAREKLPNGQSERIITHPDFPVVIRLNTDLRSSVSGAVKVTVYPKRILGILLAAEKWVYLK